MLERQILLVRQSGTYQVSGNNLTISPRTSVIEAWSKNRGIDEWGTRLNSQPYLLEKATYQFTRHYFSGIQTWSLVLQSDKQTAKGRAVQRRHLLSTMHGSISRLARNV